MIDLLSISGILAMIALAIRISSVMEIRYRQIILKKR